MSVDNNPLDNATIPYWSLLLEDSFASASLNSEFCFKEEWNLGNRWLFFCFLLNMVIDQGIEQTDNNHLFPKFHSALKQYSEFRLADVKLSCIMFSEAPKVGNRKRNGISVFSAKQNSVSNFSK